ncbi:MAG: acylphosphatase [Planctomycetota bacterium]|nr:MAG: acylphosphatase [Planctomycetota bacterium]REK31557.1 MAG: acylphosphatase [Planctomycetota bacterium]REK43105.1 MAG: acylphosphatase [Planctomycetota bacterium]
MSEASQSIRQEVFFSGQVQGVGFRYTTNRIAADYKVSGRVRNLPDGRVHLVVEGVAGEIAEFVAAIEERMGAYIRHADWTRKSEATGEYQDFGIDV